MYERLKTFLTFFVVGFVITVLGFSAVYWIAHNFKVTTKEAPEQHVSPETITVEKGKAGKTEEELKKEAEEKAAKEYKIDTDDGYLRGEERKYKYAENNETYYAFQGIPYAKPPLDNLRFRDPKPAIPWEDVLDATKEKSVCPQKAVPGRARSNVIGSEDCLYLNIYTPKRPDKIKKLKPVMVWFHGGGFQKGSGNTDYYGPDFLVKNDVVLVTFNYRLGALGFLNLQISEAPGNAGLKDQVMVLKWINSNISQFGGDPNNITLFGVDAGAASIQILTLSPDLKKRGLFHKVILQSGSVMNPWAFNNGCEEDSLALADKLGIKTLSEDYGKIVEGLRKKPIDDIVNAQDSIVTLKDIESLNLFPFVPSVEKTVNGTTKHSLITSNPYLAFASGHLEDIPTMAGITNSEANIAFLYYPELITPQFMESLNKVPDAFIPSLLQEFDNEIIKNIAKNVIKKFYFKDVHITWENIPELLKLLSDGLVSIGMYMTIEIMKDTPSSLYVYEFSLEGDLNYIGNTAKEIFRVKNDNEKTKSKALVVKKEDDKDGFKNATNTTAAVNSSTDNQKNISHEIDYDKIKITGAAHEDELGYLFLVNNFDKEIPKDKTEYKIREQLALMWTNFAKNTNPNSDKVNVDWEESREKNPTYLSIGNKLELKREDIEKDRYSFWKNLFISIFQGNPAVIMDYLKKHNLL